MAFLVGAYPVAFLVDRPVVAFPEGPFVDLVADRQYRLAVAASWPCVLAGEPALAEEYPALPAHRPCPLVPDSGHPPSAYRHGGYSSGFQDSEEYAP